MPERRKNIKKNTQSNYIQLDFIFLLLALMIVSILAIYNAQQLDQYNENFALKQTIYFAVGILFVVFVQFIDLDVIYKSEEHTSELQSRFDIVCRLLLEK